MASKLGRAIVHRFERLFAANQFVDTVGKRDFPEHGRPIVLIQAILPSVSALALLDEPDVDVDTDAVDAVTQSIEYARCSNVTAFVVPFLGHNFGVGEEDGSILEHLADTHGDWLLFVHEDDVTSAMIRSASVRWDLRVETYETEQELVNKLRRFAGGIMHRERRGDLSRLE